MISSPASVTMKISVLIFIISAVAAEININSINSPGEINCFQCNSGKDPECADLTSADKNSKYLLPCKSEAKSFPLAEADSLNTRPFCRKTIYTILNNNKLVRINRECAWELYKTNTTRCYDVDTDFKFEVNCQCFTDGCNSAPQMSSRSFIFTFLISSLVLLIKLMN